MFTLKPVNKSLSLLAAWFRLLYTAVFGFALLNLVTVLRLLSDADYLTVFGTDQLHAQVMLSLNAFSDGWAIGYVCFFSLHLGECPWLFSLQVGLHSQNSGRLVDNWRFWLSNRYFCPSSFTQLRSLRSNIFPVNHT